MDTQPRFTVIPESFPGVTLLAHHEIAPDALCDFIKRHGRRRVMVRWRDDGREFELYAFVYWSGTLAYALLSIDYLLAVTGETRNDLYGPACVLKLTKDESNLFYTAHQNEIVETAFAAIEAAHAPHAEGFRAAD